MYQKITLVSKRNDVYRIIDGDKKYILKEFKDLSDIKKETECLMLLKGCNINVPEIISIDNNILILEDLGYLTLLDWYEDNEKKNSNDYKDMIIKLCKWMKSFYDVSLVRHNRQIILLDVNFRNFIIKGNEIYGIDFEQSSEGNIESDLGKLAAYALTYYPIMTKWKVNFTDELINTLSIVLKVSKKIIIEEKEKELNNINIRRKISI